MIVVHSTAWIFRKPPKRKFTNIPVILGMAASESKLFLKKVYIYSYITEKARHALVGDHAVKQAAPMHRGLASPVWSPPKAAVSATQRNPIIALRIDESSTNGMRRWCSKSVAP